MSAGVQSTVVAPTADPQAICACLAPARLTQFDAKWDLILDRAKRDKDLTPVRSMLSKGRHIAYAEMKEPRVHERIMAKAEQILRAGEHPDGGHGDL